MNSTATIDVPVVTPFMTAEEFVQLHGEDSSVELLKGRVVRCPMPGAKHGEVCGNAFAILREFVKPHGLGRLMTNDTFIRAGKEPDTYRGADVCFIGYTRWPKEQPLPKGPLEVAPELVVEVRSPTDRLGGIQIKVGEFYPFASFTIASMSPSVVNSVASAETGSPIARIAPPVSGLIATSWISPRTTRPRIVSSNERIRFSAIFELVSETKRISPRRR